MSVRPRIFISHSSHDRVVTEDVGDLLEAQGAGHDGFEVLLDTKRLDPGRPWEPYLHEWMARCDAALILLTEDSLQSDWVLKEATILAWRLSLDPTFKFFIAKTDGLSRADVTKGSFSPLGLGQIQWLPDFEPASIASEIRAQLDGHSFEKTPFDLMVGRLGDLFENIGSTTLEVVADKLSVFREWWPSDQERPRHIEVIARHLLCGNLGEYTLAEEDGPGHEIRGLEGLIGDLADTTGVEMLRKILSIMAPHWVDGVAAGKLALLPRYEERRAVAVNGKYVPHFTSKVYLTRAHLVDASKYYFLDVAGGNAGGFVTHYSEQICDAVRDEPENDWLADLDDDDVVDELRDMSRSRYVIIPEPRPDRDDLVELMELFPTVNFVLWTGRNLDVDPGLDRVDWAEPALDEQVEKRQMKDFKASQGTIRRQEGG